MKLRESRRRLKRRAVAIAAKLARLYPQARISLDFRTPWQCLVSTILSAQCTDRRVNRVTPRLFRLYPDPGATASARVHDIEQLIVETGFFRRKARSLIEAAGEIVERFDGEVPSRMEDLLGLAGVGRKTANVVLGHVYGKPAMVVDTHVKRLARRLALASSDDPGEIEKELCGVLPPQQWTAFSMRLILHGRNLCLARKPRCSVCPLLAECPRIGVDLHSQGRQQRGSRPAGR